MEFDPAKPGPHGQRSEQPHGAIDTRFQVRAAARRNGLRHRGWKVAYAEAVRQGETNHGISLPPSNDAPRMEGCRRSTPRPPTEPKPPPKGGTLWQDQPESTWPRPSEGWSGINLMSGAVTFCAPGQSTFPLMQVLLCQVGVRREGHRSYLSVGTIRGDCVIGRGRAPHGGAGPGR